MSGQFVHFRDHCVAYCQGIGAGRLEDADRRRILVIELSAQGIVAGAEFDARDVGQAHDLAVGADLQHDVAELLGCAQAALCIDRDQEIGAFGDRLGAKLSGRDLNVLLLHGAQTSPAVSPRTAILSGSSQMRMA